MQQIGSPANSGAAPRGQPMKRFTAYSEPARQKKSRKSDPAPSRWSYRFQRLMLTPVFSFALRVGVPFALTCAMGTAYMADESRRATLMLTIADMRASIETRPEFMVNMMTVDGASPEVTAAIHEILPLRFPMTSFDVDLQQVRDVITGLNPVRDADVRVQPGGVLQVTIDERKTAALWRTRDGLFRVDGDGYYIGLALKREDHATLPLIAGDGADAVVGEALALTAAAAPLKDRITGLVRMGERRWDLVLDRGQRIMLPEQGAVAALERVIALSDVKDLLLRDLSRVDVRLGHRPTLRLNENAIDELWRIKTTALTEGADQVAGNQ